MRMKAKTSPTGYVATLIYGGMGYEYEYPVASFDADGWALIADEDTGRLVRASEQRGFRHVRPIVTPTGR